MMFRYHGLETKIYVSSLGESAAVVLTQKTNMGIQANLILIFIFFFVKKNISTCVPGNTYHIVGIVVGIILNILS